MKKFIAALLVNGSLAAAYVGQRQTTPKRPVTQKPAAELAVRVPTDSVIEGQTFTHKSLRFSVSFPEGWQIAQGDFEQQIRKQGIDLGLRAPEYLPLPDRTKLNNSLKTVTNLLIAFRDSEADTNSAVVRVSVEDLGHVPQVKDAVDYFDLMRQMYRSMKLPKDFTYSETQAEKLGAKQFAFLDTSNKFGKKRIYATVRGRKAILFTLSYTEEADLETFRHILLEGDFNKR